MKNLLQNLLILFALALCALAAWQWNQEARLRQNLQSLEADRIRRAATVGTLQDDVRRLSAEMARLDAVRKSYADMTRTNASESARLRQELELSRAVIRQSEQDAQAYRTALDKANESISAQNETAKKLAEERNEAVLRFNKLTEEFNALAKQWNDSQPKPAKTRPAGK